MNQSLEKGPDESQEDYDAHLKKHAEAADREGSRQAGEAKKWKNKAIAALVAAVLLFLFLIGYALFWNDGAQVKQVRATAAGEIKALKAEIDRLKGAASTCTVPVASSEVTGLSKALSQCLELLPKGLPYQPTAPAAVPTPAPKPKQEKKPDTKPGKVTPPADVKPPPTPDVRQPTHCRWASDGTLRLKKATSQLPADPLKEIPRDTTVETFPKANLKQGETCQTWQKAMEAEHADLQSRDRGTFRK